LAEATHAIDRALALAPQDIEVLIEVGNFHWYAYYDHERAAESYEKVLGIAPNNVEALSQMAVMRWRQVRWKECAALWERALAVDPRNVNALTRFAIFLEGFRQFDRALEVQRQLLEVLPDDLSVQSDFQGLEYKRTGSWVSFDKWRSTLPPNAERTSFGVHIWDVGRAGARRDFDEVLRLLDALPDGLPFEQVNILSVYRSVTYLVKGDHAQATDTARTALREVTAKLQDDPKNEFLWVLSAHYHAILGEREAALADHGKAHSLVATKDPLWALTIRGLLLFVYVFLRDRERALKELSWNLKTPPARSAHFARVDWRYSLLWDDPEFQAIVNDPAHNAPLPFDLGDSP